MDRSGPGPYREISAAVAAAQDGDTILVRLPLANQRYASVSIVGKALTIAADSSTGFARVQSVHVSDLPAGKTVVLSRLACITGLQATNNAGSVRLVLCHSSGDPGYAEPAMTVTSSNGSTALASCNLVGGAGGGGDEIDGFPGGAGLEVQDAIVASYDSTLTGGEGGFLYIADHAGPGGAGASVTRSALPTRLLLSNSSIQGGRGGELWWCYLGQYVSGPGGPGLELGTGTMATRHATTLTGGAGGRVPDCGTPGPAGAPLVNSGTLLGNRTSAIELTAPTIAREGQTITLIFAGVPGDRVYLISGTQTTFRELAVGPLIVQPGPTPFSQRGPLGTIGPSGTFTVAFPLPQLPPGIAVLDLWLQAYALHADGRSSMGSFSVVTVLDSVY